MRAGSLNVKIEIQKYTQVVDNEGGKTENWTTYKSLWAKHKVTSSTEGIDNEADQSNYRDEFEIRYRTDIDKDTMRAKFNNEYFSIVRAYDPNGYKKKLLIICNRINKGFGDR